MVPEDLLERHLLGEESQEQGRLIFGVDLFYSHKWVIQVLRFDDSEVVDVHV